MDKRLQSSKTAVVGLAVLAWLSSQVWADYRLTTRDFLAVQGWYLADQLFSIGQQSSDLREANPGLRFTSPGESTDLGILVPALLEADENSERLEAELRNGFSIALPMEDVAQASVLSVDRRSNRVEFYVTCRSHLTRRTTSYRISSMSVYESSGKPLALPIRFYDVDLLQLNPFHPHLLRLGEARSIANFDRFISRRIDRYGMSHDTISLMYERMRERVRDQRVSIPVIDQEVPAQLAVFLLLTLTFAYISFLCANLWHIAANRTQISSSTLLLDQWGGKSALHRTAAFLSRRVIFIGYVFAVLSPILISIECVLHLRDRGSPMWVLAIIPSAAITVLVMSSFQSLRRVRDVRLWPQERNVRVPIVVVIVGVVVISGLSLRSVFRGLRLPKSYVEYVVPVENARQWLVWEQERAKLVQDWKEYHHDLHAWLQREDDALRDGRRLAESPPVEPESLDVYFELDERLKTLVAIPTFYPDFHYVDMVHRPRPWSELLLHDGKSGAILPLAVPDSGTIRSPIRVRVELRYSDLPVEMDERS
jgi:hypothetical protein